MRRGDTDIQAYRYGVTSVRTGLAIPASAVAFIDFPPAGTHTYKIRAGVDPGANATIIFINLSLFALEL